MSSNTPKVVKAQAPTLPHLNMQERQPQGLQLPEISLSDKTKSELENISREMKRATESVATSERVENMVPDDKVLDPTFDQLLNPPDLSIASVGARKRVEANLKPLRIDDLFISGEIHQNVDIISGKMTIKFRTLRTNEDLYIKRKLSEVKNEAARYVEDRIIVMYICAHVVDINGDPLPLLTDANGNILDSNFDQRFKKISALPQVLIERIWVNLRWFEDRVRKALSPDFLGNG